MFTRSVEHNGRTQVAPNAIVRPRTGWFSNPVNSGYYFNPPTPVGIRDTNGDYVYLLANTPTQHSNPRYQGKARVTGDNEHLTTTIFS